MEDVSSRRKFFSGLCGGVAGLVTAAAYARGTANINFVDDRSVADPTLAPPSGATTLKLSGSYGPLPPPPPISCHTGYTLVGTMMREVTNTTTLAVGMDDRLWIKIGEQWRRVAIEDVK